MTCVTGNTANYLIHNVDIPVLVIMLMIMDKSGSESHDKPSVAVSEME